MPLSHKYIGYENGLPATTEAGKDPSRTVAKRVFTTSSISILYCTFRYNLRFIPNLEVLDSAEVVYKIGREVVKIKAMLHLARVEKQGLSGEPKLRLIARQESGYTWALLDGTEEITAVEANSWSDGLLVLVELSPTRQILTIKDAADWVRELVRSYLASGITPAFLQQEKEQVEEGLQSLTLEKQDLARRSVEMEARREEIQQMEIKLQTYIQVLEAEKQELETRLTSELEACHQKIRELEAKLQSE